MFEGDPLLFWRIKPNLKNVIWDFTLFSSNGQGLRYGHEVGPKKPGDFRIACFGDSVTFGYRVPTVWPERPDYYDRRAHPYHQLLEEVLIGLNPERGVEVIPYAVPGYSSHQGAAWAREVLPGLGADVVVVSYGWNDINLRGLTDRESMSVDSRQVLLRRMMMKSQALLRASAWWQAAERRRSGGRWTGRGKVTRVLGLEYVENIRAIVALAQKSGAAVVVLGPVVPRSRHRDRGGPADRRAPPPAARGHDRRPGPVSRDPAAPRDRVAGERAALRRAHPSRRSRPPADGRGAARVHEPAGDAEGPQAPDDERPPVRRAP